MSSTLTKTSPLAYERLAAVAPRNGWSDFLIDLAKDIAAARILVYLECASSGQPPFCTTYALGSLGTIQWWDDKHEVYRTP